MIDNKRVKKLAIVGFYGFLYLLISYAIFYVAFIVLILFGIVFQNDPIFISITYLIGIPMFLCLVILFIYAILKVYDNSNKNVSKFEFYKSVWFVVFFHGLYGFYLVHKNLIKDESANEKD